MYPEAYIHYLVYFHGVRDYFECHELLEEEWKKDPRGRRKPYWRGLIQIAVALYHWRRSNFTGAERSFEHAIDNLADEQTALQGLALNGTKLMDQLFHLRQNVTEHKPYESINLPITDQALIKKCERLCEEKGCIMGNPSDLTDEAILHKHRQPNRETVISKREKKKRGLY
ncbi:MAG TPA: DUF309 domain-containing protein [Bacillales bacterium]|nr:DUF309 domain-containing protein [Bacillales bacterium]